MDYAFDRYLRYDELVEWLHDTVARHPDLVMLDTYGRSHEGRDLWIVTVTDGSTGAHDTKPAHWVDASIHATELTATVAACHLIQHLADGFGTDDAVTEALRTRTFYIVPRVNPDGAEWALADSPRFRRSSTRAWPWTDGHRWPGLHREDVDGDGRLLQMRLADPSGAWMPHPDDARLMIPVPADGRVTDDVQRYRLLTEGTVVDHDGFTIPAPPAVEGLDLNRNFPAGWGTSVPGSGDHPLSEPEIDALVRAIAARPNICGTNAFHTSGGVLLRPSSTRPDSKLAPMDVWIWKQLGERGTALTGYPVYSVYEDFTWDPSETMSGAADDWAYEHLGVYGWTTEFWDIVEAATGTKQSTHFWYTGPSVDEALAVLRWCDEHHPDGHVDWHDFDHPQLGPVQIGGWDTLSTWTNPPLHLLHDEVASHADFAVFQALASPRLEIVHSATESLGDGVWRIDIGVANTGWLPTDVSALARKENLVKPIRASLTGDDVTVVGSPSRRQLGQLEGRAELRFSNGNDGTPDRVLVSWTVQASAGATVEVAVDHPRCGHVTATLTLA
jgi:murein tripeptide amidase MpaA